MKKSDYDKLVQFVNVGGGVTPVNENATELLEQSTRGEIFTFKNITERDIKFHNCYFALLRFIHGYMPKSFRDKIPERKFYYWLKHLKGQYEVIFTFKDGSTMVEYDSLAFGNMSQQRFEDYIRNQLPWIYSDVLNPVYPDEDIFKGIVETIEEEFKKFLSKL